MDGKGHPLPASDESRHGEIPEGAIEEKGFGDDSVEAVQPARQAVNPDGEPYLYDDDGRAEDVESGEGRAPRSVGPGTPV
jgi:hypothetical protein